MFEERKDKKDTKAKLTSSQKSNSVVTNRFISSQERNADLNNLFKHEISLPKPSFTSDEIHFSNKPRFLEILLAKEMQVTEEIEAPTTMIVDGSFMVQPLKPRMRKDFCEYADNVIVPFVNNILRKHNRVDEICGI